MVYSVLKSLHIIGVVSWFAGLFYIVRLFIYHVESKSKPEAERNILQSQFKIMERRLWYGITVPAMVITVVCGGWMLYLMPFWLQGINSWMHFKLFLVFLLLVYHFWCGKILKDLKQDKINWSSHGLRVWNEVATILLCGIVFSVVIRTISGAIWSTAIMTAVGAGIFIIYSKIRKKKAS